MMHYDSVWDWLFSLAPVQWLLSLGALVSFFCVLFLILRRRPFRPPFFSAGFVLALCPFLCSSLLAVLHVREFLEGGVFDSPYYVVGRLQGPVSFAIMGAWASAAALLAYSVTYRVTSKSRHA
jgi:hypothetical protein